ncbi:hypothetical protein BO94DRAFT_534520 [Aspergillus sclerotioniger CBS 115572]|uniref:Uncharacterized protein n=1 Tax=Aspergillus sclerotioniger CBS 115572 TaxID=1450535 RepID=A0A317WTW6_9EURO|nr:hypothetical protein BO94DRAFT_534520 [Aspergillus sclerotioniger CBS 115572]PWY88627.1 hypothetical protein BO94DRAFT_534520 [Aspergillus sclerotioniger CBS 115572]
MGAVRNIPRFPFTPHRQSIQPYFLASGTIDTLSLYLLLYNCRSGFPEGFSHVSLESRTASVAGLKMSL